jgi:hypothetical protein
VGGNLSKSIAGAPESGFKLIGWCWVVKAPKPLETGCAVATQPLPGDDRHAVGVDGAGNYYSKTRL